MIPQKHVFSMFTRTSWKTFFCLADVINKDSATKRMLLLRGLQPAKRSTASKEVKIANSINLSVPLEVVRCLWCTIAGGTL